MTKSIQTPKLSSLRLTTFIDAADGTPATQATVSSVTVVAYCTATRSTLTLNATLDKADVILDTPLTSSTGRSYNFAYTTPASALPTKGDYEFTLRVNMGDTDVVAAEVFPVSVVEAG